MDLASRGALLTPLSCTRACRAEPTVYPDGERVRIVHPRLPGRACTGTASAIGLPSTRACREGPAAAALRPAGALQARGGVPDGRTGTVTARPASSPQPLVGAGRRCDE